MKFKSPVFCVLLLVLFGKCVAATYFDFSGVEVPVYENSPITVLMDYKLSGVGEGSFRVRPVLRHGTAKIYNAVAAEWVTSGGLWSSFPTLAPELQIMLRFNGATRDELRFELSDIKTGIVYTTPVRTVWSRSHFEGYLSAVNEVLRAAVVEATGESSESSQGVEDGKAVLAGSVERLGRLSVFIQSYSNPILYLLMFLAGLVIICGGFLICDRISQWISSKDGIPP